MIIRLAPSLTNVKSTVMDLITHALFAYNFTFYTSKIER